MASSLSGAESEKTQAIMKRAEVGREAVGSDAYQQTHMALIFEQGLSFSGFERNKVFFGGRDGTYTDISDLSGADTDGDCRAAIVADFDDDGDPDLFVNAIQRECHMLFRNDAVDPGSKRFIKVRLEATAGHRDAIGAIVTLIRGDTRQAQVLSCGSGFESQHALELIYGVEPAEKARLQVRWPGREVERFGTVEGGTRYRLVEGTGKAVVRKGAAFTFKDPAPAGVRFRRGDRITPPVVSTLDGKKATLAIGADKPTLLVLWATTCTSCIQELPMLESLRKSGRYKIAAVSLDPESRKPRIRTLWDRLKLTFDPFLIDTDDAARLFDLPRLSIPMTIILSPEGRVQRIIRGKLTEGDL